MDINNCPCGGKAIVEKYYPFWDWVRFKVKCTVCYGEITNYGDPMSAIKSWNRTP